MFLVVQKVRVSADGWEQGTGVIISLVESVEGEVQVLLDTSTETDRRFYILNFDQEGYNNGGED